jgi:hypothetical protein
MKTDMGERVILKWILQLSDEGNMNWIHVAHDIDQWQALVNMGSLKCGEIHKKHSNCWLPKKNSAPQS